MEEEALEEERQGGISLNNTSYHVITARGFMLQDSCIYAPCLHGQRCHRLMAQAAAGQRCHVAYKVDTHAAIWLQRLLCSKVHWLQGFLAAEAAIDQQEGAAAAYWLARAELGRLGSCSSCACSAAGYAAAGRLWFDSACKCCGNGAENLQDLAQLCATMLGVTH